MYLAVFFSKLTAVSFPDVEITAMLPFTAAALLPAVVATAAALLPAAVDTSTAVKAVDPAAVPAARPRKYSKFCQKIFFILINLL